VKYALIKQQSAVRKEDVSTRPSLSQMMKNCREELPLTATMFGAFTAGLFD
jgi:hypothetical protein